MFSQNVRNKPYTQKVAGLLSLINEGLPVPPTCFVDSSKGCKDISKNVLEFLRKTSSNAYYLRLCFSDNQYPHYFSELADKHDVLIAVSRLLAEAEITGTKHFDIIIQPLLSLAVSGAILVKQNRVLIESVLGAPPTLFRNGIINSRHVLENGRLVYQKFYRQDSLLYWNPIEAKWSRQSCDKRIDFDMISSIAKMNLQNFSLYEYGIDHHGDLWIFEKKSIPSDCYISLDSIEDDKKYFTVSAGRYIDTKYIDFPDFSEIGNCTHENKYLVQSGAYTAHFPTYLALNNIACEFRK